MSSTPATSSTSSAAAASSASSASSAERIADIEIPDSALAREATELVRDTTSPLLYDHSRRVFLFGSLQGRRRGCRTTPNSSTSARCSTTSA